MSTTEVKYLIVGNSAGGIGAAEAIRSVDRSGSIAIVSDEPYHVYSRPLISKYLSKERTVEGMLFRPPHFYKQNNITLLPGRKVKRLDPGLHLAELEGGDSLIWEKLLLATGGAPIVPRIKGGDKEGVFTFTTLDDARAIDSYLEQASQAAVIGGGLIGVSVAEALAKRQIHVTIIEMKDRILNTILDETGSAIAEAALKRAGVRVIAGHTAAEVRGGESACGTVLDSGEALPCDLVVVAIGVTPRTELALHAGIRVNRGIVVDRHMEASHPGVYACGDAAEAYDFIYGANRPIPIWPGAYMGGRVAGFNMAGVDAEYPGITAMNSLNYFGLDIATAGMATAPDGQGYETISRQKEGDYRKVILKDGLVVGMVFLGNSDRSGIIFGLMRERVNVESFKQSLLADDFGLAHLPLELRQKRLETVSIQQPVQEPAAVKAVHR